MNRLTASSARVSAGVAASAAWHCGVSRFEQQFMIRLLLVQFEMCLYS
jgi:hypothetical protein